MISYHTFLAAIFGLIVGSFLNVVIYRYPKVMAHAWDEACAEHQASKSGLVFIPSPPSMTLSAPCSRCPHCGHQLTWVENIPVLSWLYLMGRCGTCGQSISKRYPFVEVVTAGLFAVCAYLWGVSFATVAWCGFCAALIALAGIDLDTHFLPDDITLPLVWSGLIVATFGWSHATLESAVIGAVSGYLLLWLIYWGFKLITGKEGLGQGDFKLFSALGAWMGWQSLLPIMGISSLVLVLAFFLGARKAKCRVMPYGPFLAFAGVVEMIFRFSDALTATV